MTRYRTIILIYSITCAIIIAGCSDDAGSNEEAGNQPQNEAEPENETKSQDEASEGRDSEEGNDADVNGSQDSEEEAEDYKNDLGNLNVWIGGEVIMEEDRIVVEGESNLLPGSEILSGGISMAGFAQLPFRHTAKVEEDGSFYFEFPARDDNMVITLNLTRFGEHRDHYGDYLENTTGPLKYMTNKEGEYKVKLSFTTDTSQETPYSMTFEPPQRYELPEDYGDPHVWMEVDVTSDHKYLYFHGRTNLLEGTRLGGNLMSASDRLVPFSHDHTSIQPDGSFDLRVHYTSLHEGMYMPIKFEPRDTMWYNAKGAYGENGEHLEGDLVHTTDDGKQYIEKIVELDIPDLSPPEEVDLTVADEEIKMQVPDHLLFDFDESGLKAEAKETLDDIIEELETLPSGTEIHINGHTDDVGDPDYNMDLSEKRVQSVLDYIQENGDITDLDISTYGFGETKPLYSNEDEEDRSKNRRVEIVINPQ